MSFKISLISVHPETPCFAAGPAAGAGLICRCTRDVCLSPAKLGLSCHFFLIKGTVTPRTRDNPSSCVYFSGSSKFNPRKDKEIIGDNAAQDIALESLPC